MPEPDRLGKLLDDLLDLDRLTRGRTSIRPQRCDAAAIVRDVVVDQLGDGPIAVGALAGIPARLQARVDPAQLQRIAHNLVENACKYAPPGPTRVTLTPLPPEGVVLEVADEGPGIDDALRDEVLEPLFRADEHHPRPGTGTGLSLVAACASLHGGSAEVVDVPTGAHLRVTLPGVPHDDDPSSAGGNPTADHRYAGAAHAMADPGHAKTDGTPTPG